jgi:hypothetical protein
VNAELPVNILDFQLHVLTQYLSGTPSGSAISTSSGLKTGASARMMRCCWPPESRCG